MIAPKNHKPWKLLGHVLRVFVPRFHEKQPVQTRLAAHGQTGGRKKLALPPLTSPANPEDHVFIPLEDYGAKIEDLFQGQEFVFIRGGVGVGKSTLRLHLARQNRQTFVSVPFQNGEEASWRANIVRSVQEATNQNVTTGDTQLQDALALAAAKSLILVLDEAHTIFSVDNLVTSLLKGEQRPRLVLFSASGEASAGMMSTTPSEITQKFFWTPTIPEVDGNFISQLEQAGVYLDEGSVEFFMKFCGGHRSIFMAAMNWVKKKQNGSPWEFKQTVTEVRDSMGANSWLVSGGILEGLAASRGVKVNGKFGNLDVVPMEFVTILCEGPGQLPPKLRRDLTVCGFVQPVPEAGHKEFRKVDWTQANTRYAVSNPVMASYYREQLKNFRGLKVRVDPYIPVSCLDLLLRAIPYLTFARVVGYAPTAAAASALSASSSPFEDQYNRAIIDALTKLGYKADSCESPTIGKVDVFVNIAGKTFSMEGIVADRGQQDHTDHRNRFDNPNLSAYSEATKKALFTIGSTERTVRDRVNATRAEGVEIIGLVPNVAYTRYHIFYRGAQAAAGGNLVEYDVECDLVARGLDVNGILCRQKVAHINSPAGSAVTTSTSSVVWVRELIRKDKQLTAGSQQEFEPTGNAFQVKGALSNVDDLKEAIEKKEKLTIAASKIDVYSQKEDGGWEKEDEDNEVNRGASKADSYGFVVPSADDA